MINPHRIHTRLILSFTALVIGLLWTSGMLITWSVRKSLEAELGSKLISVARAAEVQLSEIDNSLLARAIGERAKSRLESRLKILRDAAEVKRIYVFNLDNQSVLDTDSLTASGTEYFTHRFYQKEIKRIEEGLPAYTILFTGIEGEPVMTGFTPFLSNGEIAGGIAVTGSVPFLSGMAALKNRLLMIGVFGTGIAALLAIILSVSITRPITKLIQEAKKIGKGITGEPIQIKTKTEIRYLADTMEIMRQNINERENELKAMVGGIAHEIRNPLGAVQLFTDLLGDEMNNTDAESHLRRIKTETGAIKKLVDHFLIYARPPNPCMQDCLLEPVIHEAVSGAANQDAFRNIQVEYENLENKMLYADSGMLKQIVVNLVQNAVSAMPGGGKLCISCAKEKKKLYIKIQDTGSGIPEESHGHIFKPFFTTREKGSGLGLAIARNLMRSHKGTIRLARTDQNGTVFELIFPLKN